MTGQPLKLNEEFEAKQLAQGKKFFRISGELHGVGHTYCGHWAKTKKEAENWASGNGFLRPNATLW